MRKGEKVRIRIQGGEGANMQLVVSRSVPGVGTVDGDCHGGHGVDGHGHGGHDGGEGDEKVSNT